jgi:hypothetical protein
VEVEERKGATEGGMTGNELKAKAENREEIEQNANGREDSRDKTEIREKIEEKASYRGQQVEGLIQKIERKTSRALQQKFGSNEEQQRAERAGSEYKAVQMREKNELKAGIKQAESDRWIKLKQL